MDASDTQNHSNDADRLSEVHDTIEVNVEDSAVSRADAQVDTATLRDGSILSIRSESSDSGSLFSPAASSTSEHCDKNVQIGQPHFLEGDDALRELPLYLLHQLNDNCRMYGTKIPSCARKYWRNTHRYLFPPKGVPNTFLLQSTGDSLLSARYGVKPGHQILVVQHRHGLLANGKRAAIVFWCGNGNEPNWRIWNPSLAQGEFDPHSPVVIRRSQIPRQPLHAGIATTTQLSDRLQIEAVSVPRLVVPDSASAHRPRKRQQCHDETMRTTTPMSSLTTIDPSQNQQLSQRNWNATKEAFNPSKKSRSYNWIGPDDNASLHGSSLTSAEGQAYMNTQVTFMFKHASTEDISRQRSLSQCRTSRKLFSHALCAGTIKPDGDVLRIELLNQDALFIMKGDDDDFGLLLDRVNDLIQDRCPNDATGVEVIITGVTI